MIGPPIFGSLGIGVSDALGAVGGAEVGVADVPHAVTANAAEMIVAIRSVRFSMCLYLMQLGPRKFRFPFSSQASKPLIAVRCTSASRWIPDSASASIWAIASLEKGASSPVPCTSTNSPFSVMTTLKSTLALKSSS